MKRVLMALSIAAIMGGTVYAENPVDRRERHQKTRIQQGVKSGELTRVEARRLAAEQARIRVAETRARADGNVTRTEARRLDHRLDTANRRILRQKHDRQDR